jgi:hypothetical protein
MRLVFTSVFPLFVEGVFPAVLRAFIFVLSMIQYLRKTDNQNQLNPNPKKNRNRLKPCENHLTYENKGVLSSDEKNES